VSRPHRKVLGSQGAAATRASDNSGHALASWCGARTRVPLMLLSALFRLAGADFIRFAEDPPQSKEPIQGQFGVDDRRDLSPKLRGWFNRPIARRAYPRSADLLNGQVRCGSIHTRAACRAWNRGARKISRAFLDPTSSRGLGIRSKSIQLHHP
jgi:hypothetical protein